MAHATYPFVELLNDGSYRAQMVDKKTGRVWGTGYGVNRKQAIYYARNDQPSEGFIKRSIGWVSRHPFKAGLTIGAYMLMRRPIKEAATWCCRLVADGLWYLGAPQKLCENIGKAANVLP